MEGETTFSFCWRTKVKWNHEHEMTKLIDHPGLASSRALDDGDRVGVWHVVLHAVEDLIKDFMLLAMIWHLPCRGYS